MINKLKDKFQKESPELNTLKILIQSLKYQLGDLKSVNKNIENLKSELNGGLYQKEKRGKVMKFYRRPNKFLFPYEKNCFFYLLNLSVNIIEGFDK